MSPTIHTKLQRLCPTLLLRCAIAALASVAMIGCDNMSDDARIKPLEASNFFPDGKAARHPVAGTVPVNTVPTALTTTRDSAGKPIDAYPFEITLANLERGKQRYDIYCAVCHGALGLGDGMVVQRGFTRPPSFLAEHLLSAAPGHYVEVITNGFGAMYSYNDRVSPEDRWNIAAYIKTLQVAQTVDPSSLPPEARQQAEAAGQRQMAQMTTAGSTRPTTQPTQPSTQQGAPAAQ